MHERHMFLLRKLQRYADCVFCKPTRLSFMETFIVFLGLKTNLGKQLDNPVLHCCVPDWIVD